MEITKVIVEKVTVFCQENEVGEALEYVSNGKYEIVGLAAVRDARSGHYLGGLTITAERLSCQGSGKI